jgi:hypothetical protein
MARALICNLFFLFATGSLYSQDTLNPIQVLIRIQKEYSVTHNKEYYRREGLNITKDSVSEKRFDVEVTIENTTSKSIFVWLMSTYWEENFLINNNYIFFAGRDIDHNFPKLVEVKPKGRKVYYTTLVKSIKFDYPCKNCIYGPQVETTRLGLIVISDIFNVNMQIMTF